MRFSIILSVLSFQGSRTDAFLAHSPSSSSTPTVAAIATDYSGTSCRVRRDNLLVLRNSENQGDDDDELIRLIRGPLGVERPRIRPKAIMILSDTTGVTAKAAVEKGLQQFNSCDERFFNIQQGDSEDDDLEEACETMSTRLFPFVRSEDEVAAILKRVSGVNALVVFTMADPDLREQTCRMCELSGVEYVDLLGPMFDSMSTFFQREPLGMIQPADRPNRRRALSDNYYRRIEAVEFTLKCDDGMSPDNLKNADVIILGVSRTGKTPLSVVLAQSMGLKVSNIPLVVDLPPPRQLFEPDIDHRRVFCLTLHADDLERIRRNRLKREMRGARKRGAARNTCKSTILFEWLLSVHPGRLVCSGPHRSSHLVCTSSLLDRRGSRLPVPRFGEREGSRHQA